MDAMERYCTTDASLNPNVLPGLPLEDDYEIPVKLSCDSNKSDKGNTVALPMFYGGYLGNPQGLLAKAHGKISRLDPWMLTAEELLCLLRVLTDDILAISPDLAADITDRCVKFNMHGNAPWYEHHLSCSCCLLELIALIHPDCIGKNTIFII